MKPETNKILRKIIKEEISRLISESALQDSIAYKIFKKHGVPSAYIWAKNDNQEQKIDDIIDALQAAGFKSRQTGSEYINHLVLNNEVVYYNMRTGDVGLSAIFLAEPPAPDIPKRVYKSKPTVDILDKDFNKLSSREKIVYSLVKDIKDSGLTKFTAQEWRNSAESRGTFDSIDQIVGSSSWKLSDLWPKRFHQLMKMLVNLKKIKMTKLGSKNIYTLE